VLGNPQLKAGEGQGKSRFKKWWRLVGSAVEHAADALVDAEQYKTDDKKTAKPIDFGVIFSAVEAEDEEASGVGQILYILSGLPVHVAGRPFQSTDIADFIKSCDEIDENDRNTLCQFFDTSGRRGTDIPAITIGKRLKTIMDAPVQVGPLMMVMKKVEGGGTAKASAFYRIETKAGDA
jgi:hypothetical protein